ncbi:MAG: DUF308 domain-containing protein [Ruminococcus sp.]|nr:DUF308 domain-containing protein [Ruminococcus sp.]
MLKMLPEKIKETTKSFKRSIIIMDLAMLVLGILMVIFSHEAGKLICITVGILMILMGVVRLIKYFTKDSRMPFGSFGLAQGAALLGFGIFFVACPELLQTFLGVSLGIILIVCGIMKLQYVGDAIKLKSKMWPVSLLGTIASVTMGIITLFNTDQGWIILFIGIALIVNSVWDILSVFILSKNVEDYTERLEQAMKNDK